MFLALDIPYCRLYKNELRDIHEVSFKDVLKILNSLAGHYRRIATEALTARKLASYLSWQPVFGESEKGFKQLC